MACQAVQMWSLSGLVAAFLDLAIAYLLLCASAVAYLASKFLGFFGLNLPCPCDGMFINIHSKSFCFNRLLVDFPTQKVLDVQLSAKQKFPFSDSICPKRHDYSIGGYNCVNGILEMEDGGSCSSVSDARRSIDVVRREMSSRTGKYDMKEKGVMSHRPGSRLRYRKVASGHGKKSSVSSYDSPLPEEVLGGERYSHFSTNNKGNGFIGGSLLPIDNAETHHLEYDNKAPTKMSGRKRAVTSVEMNQSPDEDVQIKKSILSIEELQDNQRGVQSFGGDEKNAIRLLEQTLEEERITRAALYIELEKERSAAATAADEAMAMILRLQEEKASIEMEARQYQRILEEKSAYDAEEMNILKEILVRREKEKHFLEKEVEAYRQMVSVGNEQLAGDGLDKSDARQIFGPLLDPNDDPVLILHQLNASNDKKVTMENKCSDGVVSMDKPNCESVCGMESPIQCYEIQSSFEKHRDSNENSVKISVCSSYGNMDLQEKEIISADKNIQLTSKAPLECQKTIPLDTKELEQVQEMNLGHKLVERIVVACNGTGTGDPNCDTSLKPQAKDALPEFSSSCDRMLDKDPLVYDVHIIGDGINFCSEANEDKSEQLSVSSSSRVCERNSVPFEAVQERINVIADCPSTSHRETEADIKRSSSEITRGLPPIGPRGLSLLSDQRRSSTSAVDSEMLKIDSEVGRLRERLKLVQEGREKLGLSLENRERENLQLKLLEDIARQVQEIQYLTEPGKAVRQVSLPLPTSKVLSKKRRSRSVSSGLQISSEGMISNLETTNNFIIISR